MPMMTYSRPIRSSVRGTRQRSRRLFRRYALPCQVTNNATLKVNRRALRRAAQPRGYSLSHAYANAMSSKNATMVTTAKSTSAILVHLLSGALRALGRTRELLLRGGGHVNRPPQHAIEQAHQGIDGEGLQQERGGRELIHPALHRANGGHNDHLG